MIFERQDYQQECIENIITLLEHFDFKAHSTQNLKECLQDFYAKTNANTLNSANAINSTNANTTNLSNALNSTNTNAQNSINTLNSANKNSTNLASPLNSTNTPPPPAK